MIERIPALKSAGLFSDVLPGRNSWTQIVLLFTARCDVCPCGHKRVRAITVEASRWAEANSVPFLELCS